MEESEVECDMHRRQIEAREEGLKETMISNMQVFKPNMLTPVLSALSVVVTPRPMGGRNERLQLGLHRQQGIESRSQWWGMSLAS